MGKCWICEKQNEYWFSNELCISCDKLVHLIKAIGSEKVAKSLSVRLKDPK